ncbi:tyrosine-type recombinase/integrase [Phycisphaeraceae bacterium D3-23]
MAKTQTKPPRKNAAPGKPHPSFELTPHPSGRWRKIHKGVAYYFGSIDDHVAAHKKFLHDWPFIVAGKVPPPMQGDNAKPEDYTSLRDAINIFLDDIEERHEQGEVKHRYRRDLEHTARLILKAVDPARDFETIVAADFKAMRAEFAKGRSLQTLKNHIVRSRSIFKWLVDDGVRNAPLQYGRQFSVPRARAVRIERRRKGDRAFTRDEIHALLDAKPNVHLRAQIMLALNCGYGPEDCADLHLDDVDHGMLEVARTKTGFCRRAVLWSETLKALDDSLAKRPTPTADDAKEAFFITTKGRRVQHGKTYAIVQAFKRLKDRAGVGEDGQGLYACRHSYRTCTDELVDRGAVDLTMGWAPDKDMRNTYVSPMSVKRARLKAVADHVHDWLFEKEDAGDD